MDRRIRYTFHPVNLSAAKLPDCRREWDAALAVVVETA
jgi:hypothetical protein